MSVRNDVGPAFPPMHNPETHESGMSLRDWFAGQALAALIEAKTKGHIDQLKGETPAEAISRESYLVADAMLEARK